MGIILAIVLLVVLLWALSAYNGLVRLRNACEEAFSTMDIYLKKRVDLTMNLVNTVKGNAKFEQETLQQVIEARNHTLNGSYKDRIQAENELSNAVTRLLAVSEAYPELKANQGFLALQKELQQMEEEIANSRRYYNGCVRNYNIRIQTIPTNIIASLGKFEEWDLFEINDEERKNVKVEF